jgi:prolyl-tRNA synthetase
MRGVPLRLEIGPKDIEKKSVFSARRDTKAKAPLPMDGIAGHVTALLDDIQSALLARARAFREAHTSHASTYDEFREVMEGRPVSWSRRGAATPIARRPSRLRRRRRSATSVRSAAVGAA